MAGSVSAIKVKVQPKASRNEILGFRGDVLQVRMTAPPERGKANLALVDLLAEALRVSKSSIRILKGHTARNKLLAVDGLSQDDLQHRLGSDPPG